MLYTNTRDSPLKVFNPKWMQALLYFGVIFFIGIAALLLYYFFSGLWNGKLAAFIILLLGIPMAYLAYIGLLLFKYIPATLNYNDSGITITLIWLH